MLACLHQRRAMVAELSNTCPVLKDIRGFETSVCLWLLWVWVQISSIVIFSDNQRLIQIETLGLLFSLLICIFMSKFYFPLFLLMCNDL